MAKLEDLNLRDDEPVRTVPSTGTDPRTERWYQFSEAIDDLLASGRYTWAEDTLRSIQETVQQTERVTEGQERAVRNIEQARQRTPRGRSRRYY